MAYFGGDICLGRERERERATFISVNQEKASRTRRLRDFSFLKESTFSSCCQYYSICCLLHKHHILNYTRLNIIYSFYHIYVNKTCTLAYKMNVMKKLGKIPIFDTQKKMLQNWNILTNEDILAQLFKGFAIRICLFTASAWRTGKTSPNLAFIPSSLGCSAPFNHILTRT